MPQLIAMPVWENRISPVFDVARHFSIWTVESGDVVNHQTLDLVDGADNDKIALLEKQGIDVMICGAISHDHVNTFSAAGIQLVSFAAGEPYQLLQAFLDGRLLEDQYRMPGCGRKHRHHGRRGRNL